MRSFSAFLASAVMAGAPVAQTGQADKPLQSAAEWRAAARTDVLAAYDIFAANHPGMFDPNNPGFPEQLARARDLALAKAHHASDRTSFGDALGTFSAELADGHAFLFGASDPRGMAGLHRRLARRAGARPSCRFGFSRPSRLHHNRLRRRNGGCRGPSTAVDNRIRLSPARGWAMVVMDTHGVLVLACLDGAPSQPLRIPLAGRFRARGATCLDDSAGLCLAVLRNG